MQGANYDSAETLQKIYTLHKRVSVIALGMLFVILLVQLFWVVLFVILNQQVHEVLGGPPPSTSEHGFKTLDQLNDSRPVIPKKFD